MTTAVSDLTILGPHWALLRDLVLGASDREQAAYLLLGEAGVGADPWHGRAVRRLITHDVIAIPAGEVESADREQITWSTDSFVALLGKAKDEGLIPAVVHSHVPGPARFSARDDGNESLLLRLTKNRNGSSASLGSLLLTHGSGACARLWEMETAPLDIGAVRILGDRLSILPAVHVKTAPDEAFHRQALAFGDAFNFKLRNASIGVVGCGGTGSAVVMLLARLGVARLVLIDRDHVERTNLHRLHGATMEDASAKRLKVEVARREVERIGFGTRVAVFSEWVDAAACRDALKACDAIFGCTDDDSGRMFLNRLAYFYGIPIIDMGLAIKVSNDDPPRVQDLSGRVTVIQPGEPCLICRDIVDPRLASEQDLRRRNPEEFERRKAEAYVIDGGDPNPAVVTFTTSVAAMAINELIDLLVGYRKGSSRPSEWRRRFHLMRDSGVDGAPAGTCPVCASRSYWGRGDVEPFLDRVG
jgi:molybdopterin/thiamine biosynthesis adenylyltransferase